MSLERATTVLPATVTSSAPPVGKDDVLTIVYSGDGGWADLDQQLGNAFVARGIPVLGVSTMRYFWRERSPEESARELDALMTRYLVQWDKRRVWLVGYSFGADVLPSIIDRLSPENRARVTQLVLLSPSRDVNFEIEIEGYMRKGWLTTHTNTFFQWLNPVHHYAALPPLLGLHNQPPVSCYYGLVDADESLCTLPSLPRSVQVYALPGDHHFNEGYQALANQLMQRIPAATIVPAATATP